MIKNLIFSGGGLKGWAYIGTLKALHEYNNYINYNSIEPFVVIKKIFQYNTHHV